MKKEVLGILLIVVFSLIFTGCSNSGNDTEKTSNDEKQNEIKSDAQAEELLEIYAEGFKEVNADKMLSVFPSFARDHLSLSISNDEIKKASSQYGDIEDVSYNLKNQQKLEKNFLDELNKQLSNVYKDYINSNECYKLEGTMTIKGNKRSYTGNISNMWYCNYSDNWFLISK